MSSRPALAGEEVAELRSTAVALAREAAELVRERRGSLGDYQGGVDTKSTRTDVVTEADHAAERLIRQRLAELRPGDAVLGEEGGGEEEAGPDAPRWVVDPIDGTVNYLYGYPWYGVSVAVQYGGTSVAGAVVEPASGRVWSAGQGLGATLDDMPLSVSDRRELDTTLVATGFAYDPARRSRQASAVSSLLGVVRDVRRAGAASLDLCAVAAGWVDAYAEHGLHRWDWAAGALIAAEAGAVVRLPGSEPGVAADLGGSPGSHGSDLTFVAAPGIADALWSALPGAGFGSV
ncbi:inositol monophosphatase [Actinoalloteichus sp. AHMU CJ021]|nr:inositol monophosphatase [Actinoalloteichus sp. AHMU CJ021]